MFAEGSNHNYNCFMCTLLSLMIRILTNKDFDCAWNAGTLLAPKSE